MYAAGFCAGASENVHLVRRSERPQPALGEAVRQLRERRGATQEAVARDAGITTATLSLIERGQANPTWDTLKKITAALGSSMGELARLNDGIEGKA
jgi:transcriptional regulator with XRE-family HTH domain